MTKRKARGADDVALDPKAQAARQGRHWGTLCRWMEDPEIGYPRPDFYIKKTPFVWLSTLQTWEATRATEAPGEPGMLRRGRLERDAAAREAS